MGLLTHLFICLTFALTFQVSASDKMDTSAFDAVDKMFEELNGSCNYPLPEKYKSDAEMICLLEKLRKRCNKIDDCYSYCLSHDVGLPIGGGCAHLCNYSNKQPWESPPGIRECRK